MNDPRDDKPLSEALVDADRTVEQRVIGADEGGVELGIDDPVVAAPARPMPRPAPAGDDATAAEPRWPSGESPKATSIVLSDAELRQASGFGEPPAKWTGAPLYALRVYRRSRALRERLASCDERLARATSAREAQLADMVLGLRTALEDDPSLGALLDPVRRIEARLAERHRALAETDREYEKIAAEADARVDGARKEVSAKRATEQLRAGELGEIERNQQRVLERLKRLASEVASIRQATAQASADAPQAPLSPESAARIRELEEQLAAAEPERKQLADQVEAARGALTEADSELGKASRALSTYEAERRAIDRRFQEKLGARAEEVRSAETQRVAALADVGRAVLAQPSCVKIDSSTLDGVTKADAEVAELTVDRERLARAMATFDQAAVTRGYTVAGIFVVLLGLIAVLVVAVQL